MQATKKRNSGLRLISRGKNLDGKPNKVDIHIGRRIRLRRNLLGWSQEELGQFLGLTFQQIQKYEKGINRVSGSRLYDFAAVLGVSVGFFFEDMSEDIRQQSPRHISTTIPFGSPEFEEKMTQPQDPMQSDRALNIMRAFMRISPTQIADVMYELIQLLGTSTWRLKKQETDNQDEDESD